MAKENTAEDSPQSLDKQHNRRAPDLDGPTASPAADSSADAPESGDPVAAGPEAEGPLAGSPEGSASGPAAGDRDATDKTDALSTELDRVRDQHLRLAADFDNFRRRSENRLRMRWNRARVDLVSRILDPLDDLRRVADCTPGEASSAEAILEGVQLVERKFAKVLEDVGVEVVDPGGQPFDPNTMEAMMRVPAESDEDDDTVDQVFQRGYTLNGQLVRAARVSVLKTE